MGFSMGLKGGSSEDVYQPRIYHIFSFIVKFPHQVDVHDDFLHHVHIICQLVTLKTSV
jgi:hypothetical protein